MYVSMKQPFTASLNINECHLKLYLDLQEFGSDYQGSTVLRI